MADKENSNTLVEKEGDADVVIFEDEEYVVVKPEINASAVSLKARYADTRTILILSVVAYFTITPLYYYVLSFFTSLFRILRFFAVFAIIFQIWYTRLLYKYLNKNKKSI